MSLCARLTPWLLAGALLALIASISAAIAAHPAVVTAEAGPATGYLVVLAAAVLAYGAITVLGMRPAASGLSEGWWCGLACGAAWIVEVLVANVIRPAAEPPFLWLYMTLYFGSSLVALLLPGLAGLLAARRAGSLRAGLRAGLLCAMCGGLIIFLGTLALSAVLIPAGYRDPQTVQEFQRSGLPDLTTYIVSDYLAGMTMHLWIGLVSGLLFGLLGGLLGQRLARPRG